MVKINEDEWSSKTMVTFHAGALHTKDNTLKSVEKAIETGAQIVEFDVTFRPDGTPVMIHKENPGNTEGEYLYKALEIVSRSTYCKINLDLKSTANLPGLEKLIRQYGLYDRVFYTGVSADWVEKVRSESTIPYYLNHAISVKEGIDEHSAQKLAEKAIELGAVGVNSNYFTATRMFCDIMHKNNLLVSLWTVNTECDMKKAISYNVDNITTKRPLTLHRLIKKYIP